MKKTPVPQGTALYKAFATIPEDVDEINAFQMIVDTSGDTFGACPEDAIRNLYQSLPGQKLQDLVQDFFFGATDEPVDRGDKAPSAGSKLILIKIIPNKEGELAKGIITGEIGKDCQIDVALCQMPGGVTNCLAEYDILTTAAWTKESNVNDVTMLEFQGELSGHETDQFPHQIKFKVRKNQRDVSYLLIHP